MPTAANKSARLIRAVLANIDLWIDEAAALADEPSRLRALNHQRNLLQAKRALEKLAGIAPAPPGSDQALIDKPHSRGID